MDRKRHAQQLGCGIWGVSLGYTALIVLWTLASLLPAGNQWPLQGLAVVGSWFYLPMWLLLTTAFLRRHRGAVVILVIPLLLFLHDYGRYFTPRWPGLQVATAATATATNRDIPVRVMTWNSYFRNRNEDALIAALAELEPDVVAIQELGYGINDALAQALGERFPYQVRFPAGGPEGMALLSRYPILASDTPDFGYRGCNCLAVTIDVEGCTVTVLNTHPWPPHVHIHPGDPWRSLHDFSTAGQDETFDALLTRIEEPSGPLLLLGDFNTTERQYNYRRVAARLTDAFAEAGWGMGYTFPTVKRVYGMPVFPVLRLDYIFHSDEWHTKRIWRGTIDGSDHRYLVADLVLHGGTVGQ
ncbi:MAG: endonuclease/exonuclease/phosphatase family protein [Caldilineaceae bacterium]|nr:endonuclease/exonuclease/phosphatase family protein [Caldilineaceae bacterium]